MTRVAVMDDWQGIAASNADWSAVKDRAEVVFFREPFADADDVVAKLAGFDVLVAMRERTGLFADVIDRLPNLKLLSFTGARNAAVDVPACTARGIVVCYTQGSAGRHATAELALTLLLACARHVALGDAEIRAGRFQENVPPGLELKGRTLGLIGLGKIGARMAQYAHALEMDVIAWSQNLTDARAAEVGVARVAKDELLARADAISLHLVLSDRSRGILGAADLARLKPGAIVVNTSRGPLIDRAALLEALQQRRIYAALDVFDVEPLPVTDALRTAPNTILAPHLGYVSTDGMSEFYQQSAENIAAWLDGHPVRVVNPDVLPKPAT